MIRMIQNYYIGVVWCLIQKPQALHVHMELHNALDACRQSDRSSWALIRKLYLAMRVANQTPVDLNIWHDRSK